MTPGEAISHIWGLTFQVDQEFCCSLEESQMLAAETADALAALGWSGEPDGHKEQQR